MGLAHLELLSCPTEREYPSYNLTLAAVMFAGRFLVIVPVLCIAGTMTNKGRVEPAVGAVPTHGIQFVGLLVGAILTVGGLTF
jgi:potassium-transporting ATPase potassium-binding subunit